jgi:transposase
VDECGINEDLKREYGRSDRGLKVEDVKRGRKFHRVNVVAAQSRDADGVKRFAAECYQGPMNGERFEKWFKNCLLKDIVKGNTVIMDNARFHRKNKLEEICKEAEIKLLFLSPYSPDFNPIEKTWANMKHVLRDTMHLSDLAQTAIYNYFDNCSKVV